MTRLIRVLLSLTRWTAADLLARANAVYAGLNLNPAYPNPPVPIPEFRLAIDDFSAALSDSFDGGTKALARRDSARETLSRMYRQLGHYVEAHCNDDMTMFLSSGFQASVSARSRSEPVSESIQKIATGALSGQILVSLRKLPTAVAYELRWGAIPSGGDAGALRASGSSNP